MKFILICFYIYFFTINILNADTYNIGNDLVDTKPKKLNEEENPIISNVRNKTEEQKNSLNDIHNAKKFGDDSDFTKPNERNDVVLPDPNISNVLNKIEEQNSSPNGGNKDAAVKDEKVTTELNERNETLAENVNSEIPNTVYSRNDIEASNQSTTDDWKKTAEQNRINQAFEREQEINEIKCDEVEKQLSCQQQNETLYAQIKLFTERIEKFEQRFSQSETSTEVFAMSASKVNEVLNRIDRIESIIKLIKENLKETNDAELTMKFESHVNDQNEKLTMRLNNFENELKEKTEECTNAISTLNSANERLNLVIDQLNSSQKNNVVNVNARFETFDDRIVNAINTCNAKFQTIDKRLEDNTIQFNTNSKAIGQRLDNTINTYNTRLTSIDQRIKNAIDQLTATSKKTDLRLQSTIDTYNARLQKIDERIGNSINQNNANVNTFNARFNNIITTNNDRLKNIETKIDNANRNYEAKFQRMGARIEEIAANLNRHIENYNSNLRNHDTRFQNIEKRQEDAKPKAWWSHHPFF